jgi:hypothetical protein
MAVFTEHAPMQNFHRDDRKIILVLGGLGSLP